MPHTRLAVRTPALFLAALLCTGSLTGVASLPGPGLVPGVQSAPAPPSALEDLRGRGWGSIAGCLTCIGGGVYLLTSGKVALMTALFREGSALALASCIAACNDAIG